MSISEGTSHSLINLNLGALATPADTLIKKVSDAVGGLYRPRQIRKVAQAEAEAALIKSQAQIEITDIERRAVHRWIQEEGQRQQNMDAITGKSIPLLSAQSRPQEVEDDWISNFFDKCRIVSHAQMQDLWSRVLAGEANTPGRFSKRTVNFLADVDRFDAELFTRICNYAWLIEGDLVPFIFDYEEPVYSTHEVTFDLLLHLANIGLVTFDGISTYSQRNCPEEMSYFGRSLFLNRLEDPTKQMNVGRVLLTKTGQELAPICQRTMVDGFFEFVEAQLKESPAG